MNWEKLDRIVYHVVATMTAAAGLGLFYQYLIGVVGYQILPTAFAFTSYTGLYLKIRELEDKGGYGL